MNQENSYTTTLTPKASLLLMEDDLCKRESVISRASSVGCSSRVFHYYHNQSLEGVPFKWEMQPGTPMINPPPDEICDRPITPPPAFLSHGFSKPSIVGDSKKHSLFPANLKLWRWKNLRQKYFSRWSSQNMLSNKDYKNDRHGTSNSCDELERFKKFDEVYRSSSSSSSLSSSSKDL